jgi:hypothetical protein
MNVNVKPGAAVGKQNSALRASDLETQSAPSKTAVAANVSDDQKRTANLTASETLIEIAIRKRAAALSDCVVRRRCVASLSDAVIDVTPLASSARFASKQTAGPLVVLGPVGRADLLVRPMLHQNAICNRCSVGSMPMATTC